MLSRSLNRCSWKTNRLALNEELKSRIQFGISSAKQIPQFTNLSTPEFSKFVFLVPASFMFAITSVSISPLLFERIIPYHIRTVAFSIGFFTLVDLAVSLLGRPTPTAHHRVPMAATFAYAYASLLGNTAVVVVGDADPRKGYSAALCSVFFHAVPAFFLPMPSWVRLWRLGLLSISAVSLVSAWRQLNYLEKNWHSLIHDS